LVCSIGSQHKSTRNYFDSLSNDDSRTEHPIHRSTLYFYSRFTFLCTGAFVPCVWFSVLSFVVSRFIIFLFSFTLAHSFDDSFASLSLLLHSFPPSSLSMLNLVLFIGFIYVTMWATPSTIRPKR
jgi:hypothetical protein